MCVCCCCVAAWWAQRAIISLHTPPTILPVHAQTHTTQHTLEGHTRLMRQKGLLLMLMVVCLIQKFSANVSHILALSRWETWYTLFWCEQVDALALLLWQLPCPLTSVVALNAPLLLWPTFKHTHTLCYKNRSSFLSWLRLQVWASQVSRTNFSSLL